MLFDDTKVKGAMGVNETITNLKNGVFILK